MHTPARLPALRKHLQRLGARAERSLPVALMRRFIETDLMTQAASLSFYALLSLWLAVIFGLLNVINFAHGECYMLGAFMAYLVIAPLHLP